MLACGLALLAAPALGQDEGTSPADAADAVQAQEDTKAEKGEKGKKKPAPAPDIVRVGGLINDIQQLDLQSHSYNVDMYLWFKWKNPDIDPARSFEFLNAFEFWGHILTYEQQPFGAARRVLLPGAPQLLGWTPRKTSPSRKRSIAAACCGCWSPT